MKELKEFLAFLQQLWSLLAGVSVFFPLSNRLLDAIPIGTWPDGGFVYLGPGLVTVCSSVGCLFLVLWTYGQRGRWRSEREAAALSRSAVRSLIGAVASLAGYLIGYTAVRRDAYFTLLGWESDHLGRLVGDLLLAGLYAASFVMLTRAFLLLGLREFLASRAVSQ